MLVKAELQANPEKYQADATQLAVAATDERNTRIAAEVFGVLWKIGGALVLLLVIPGAWSFASRLLLLLRVRLALLMNRGSSERDLKNVIQEAPRGACLAAIVTADPLKL